MRESVLQKGIMEYLGWREDALRLYWFRAGSGAMKLESGRYFKTGRPGVPDIVVIMKGRFIGLEVKTPKGRQSEAQEKAQNQIQRAGGEYYIVRSISDVKEILE